MREIEVKYLILGAGISGLGFANFIGEKDFFIIEKEKEVGGYCRTIYKKDFIWDYAGHFFHFKTKEINDYFNKRIKADHLTKSIKNTKIFYKNKLIDYPFQKNIHQLDKEEFIECLYDLFNKEEKGKYNNFIDMLYGKFGKSITEKFLKPYNEKLYACDLRMLDVDAMGRFFPYASKEEIIKNMKEVKNESYNDIFMYPKRGAQYFIDILKKDIEKHIIFNEKIKEIDSYNKIVITSNYKIKYKYLINTIPLNTFIEMENKDLYNSKKNIFTYNKVLVFNLGFNKKAMEKIHWGYIPDKSINFYRIGFYDNILNGNKLSMYIEIGYSYNQYISKEEIKLQLDLTLQNLKKLKVITEEHILEDYEYIIMDPAYVHINSEVNILKEQIKDEYMKKNIYTIGRYGDWKYCSMEDCLLDGFNLSKILKEEK